VNKKRLIQKVNPPLHPRYLFVVCLLHLS
jgi:hypothetical protein